MGPFFTRARFVHHREGLLASLRKRLTFLLVYEYFTCYLYESTLKKRNESDFTPKIKEFNLEILSTKQQLKQLVDAHFDLGSDVPELEYRLETGAIGCLVFVKKELASMEWAAMNTEAKATIDNYPCRVGFANKEAYAGGVWTNPKFRGNGLHAYVYYRIYDFLRENGILKVRSIVAATNTAAIRAHEKFAPEEKIVSRARYLRILGLQFWKETPLI